ncbi:co-chaperone YbbN [[Phormidium] sp. ETS-05]|uniref:thioredoxin family protein n=1 Tax=[Phormidium] sp. ETS-05 TaxID=222819 RepID=UPI0018EF007A|nr:thioredoxin domain-containing protein [[Phormidium] sp. ETS-05]
MLSSVSEQTFTKEVLESTTPVLVHFWAPWCGVCLMIDPILRAMEAEWGGDIKIVGINADRSLKLACTYRLTTLPTLIWFEGGQVRQRIEGFLGREELRSTLEYLSRGSWQLRTADMNAPTYGDAVPSH